MDSKPRAAPLVILYDRMTPAAQQRLIERFVVLHPDRLVKLTALRARVKTRRNDAGRSP
jgi:hypothetical protein